MSCENEFFIHEEQLVRQTWLKDVIDGKYPNIDYLFYRGGSDRTYLDENNVYHIHCEDDIKNKEKKKIFRKGDTTSTKILKSIAEDVVKKLNGQNIWKRKYNKKGSK